MLLPVKSEIVRKRARREEYSNRVATENRVIEKVSVVTQGNSHFPVVSLNCGGGVIFLRVKAVTLRSLSGGECGKVLCVRTTMKQIDLPPLDPQ